MMPLSPFSTRPVPSQPFTSVSFEGEKRAAMALDRLEAVLNEKLNGVMFHSLNTQEIKDLLPSRAQKAIDELLSKMHRSGLGHNTLSYQLNTRRPLGSQTAHLLSLLKGYYPQLYGVSTAPSERQPDGTYLTTWNIRVYRD
jgi:hypothetical protein